MNDKTKRTTADCEIIEQIEIAPHVFRSILVEPTIARVSKPGQFVNVRVSESFDPLLRRPFSVHAADPEAGTFSLLYDVIGRGTRILRDKKVGDKVNVVGPLGSFFELGDDPNDHHILVAGGCGAAPIHFLSDALCHKHGCDKVTVLVGAKTGTALLCQAEFVSHGVRVELATDDGSFGFKGLVTELLDSCLESTLTREINTRVYSCGPMPMMREVARVCHERGIESCQVSLESAMACGLGVCMGCVTKACDHHEESCDDWRYSRVCTDGPVFDAKELVWE